MNQNLLALLVFYAISSTVLGGLTIYAQAVNNKQLIVDLNVSQTAFMIQTANAKRLQHRNDELTTAVTCLLRAMDKPTSIKAIKATPLPRRE